MSTKKIVTKAEFDKRVEIEYCFLVYTEYMQANEAWSKARKAITESYQVS